jgi:hypothetical protein
MTSRKISLDGTHKQIIDLNENMVNFVVEFTITPQQSDMDKPYEITITTQEKLDAGVEAKFTQISGVFNKTIKNTTGTYQNYCLMISSKTEIKDITITIKLTEIAVEQVPTQQFSQSGNTSQGQVHTQGQVRALNESQSQLPQSVPVPTPTHEHVKNDYISKKVKIIVGALIVIVGGCALYYFWNKSKKGISVSLTTSADIPHVTVESPVIAPHVETPAVLKQIPSTTFSFY